MPLVTADTSFLFSLFGNDANTAAAQGWARQSGQPIAIGSLQRFELENALRFAAICKVISPADALGSLTAVAADLQSGHLYPVACDLEAVTVEASRLSALYTLGGGHRSFDILHVATARVLNATTFLTFDANRRRLAAAVKLAVAP